MAPKVERLRFDVIHLSNGSLAKAQKLIDLAKRDYRDVLSAEYQWINGNLVPHDWAKVHSVNSGQ
jgi:hypothetical protein